MSIIKRLKLQGFKSFANPTVLNFENGFNTIVGANGSGKSNVFDALCFVLGRMSSKGLRADKLGNLVFNGGKHQNPSKEAEVSIFLSNDVVDGQRELLAIDVDEVKITRIVNKDGGSKYLLNNQKVTRTEIVEVLKRAHIDPDGYNIILQGDIMRIVNMSSSERRELIEDISQVSEYEDKRQDSLKKLEQVEQNLKDADLLLNEKTKYLKELKSEKENAEAFYKTKSQLQEKSLLLIKGKILKNARLIEQKEQEKVTQQQLLDEQQEKINHFSGKIQEIDTELEQIEKTIEITSHGDFLTVTNSITRLEGEIKNLQERKSEYTKQQQDVDVRIKGLEESISQTQKQITKLQEENKEFESLQSNKEKELATIQTSIQKIRGGIGGSYGKELEEIESQIEELRDKKYQKEHQNQELLIQVERLNTKIEHIESQMRQEEQKAVENKDQLKELEDLRKELKTIIIEISKTANTNSEYSARWGNLRQELERLREQEHKLSAKIQQNMAHISSNRAVEEILKFKSKDSNIIGTVSELATVDSKFSKALETIAGRALSHIVVKDDTTATTYINYLKEKRVGTVTFLPLNKLRGGVNLQRDVLTKKGVVDYALNLVEFSPQYKQVFELIFTDTVVIEKIDYAKAIGIGVYKMVSLDGDIVAKTGAMSGGYRAQKQSGGGFNDQKTRQELDTIQRRIITVEQSLQEVKNMRDDSENSVYSLREKKANIEGDISKLEKILSVDSSSQKSLQYEFEQINGDKQIVSSQIKKLIRDIDEVAAELQKLEEKKRVLKDKQGGNVSNLEQLNSLEEQKEALQAEIFRISKDKESNNIQINNVLQVEIKNSTKIIQDSKEAKSRLQAQIKEFETTISTHSKELQELQKKEKELSKEYEGIITKRNELKEKRIYQEKRYTNEYEKFEKLKEASNKISYNLEEYKGAEQIYKEEEEMLISEIQADFIEHEHAATFEEFVTFIEKTLESIEELKTLQNEVNTLKTKLSGFGSLNLKAVAVYDKIKEEFDELLQKREKLNVEKDDILSFISDMDEKKRIKFMQTFTILKEKFAQVYSQLSSKGEAELLLENEKDIFNSGVEIKVRLSKKNYLDIKSLSGGEKTITAVAFIFAVQEFNPANFYIFDEIDAALDIMNCEKLGKLIAQNSSKAQYIVVSHSEYLIQSSQFIYGVTMDTNKVSGVVSLDLENISGYVDSEEA